MRKNIVAGNWKMNKNFQEAKKLMEQILNYIENNKKNCEVLIAVPYLYICEAKNTFQNINIYAQDVSQFEAEGAYTGDISSFMLESIGISGSIVAHSERRQYYLETDNIANIKIKNLLKKNLTPIYCNGESLDERKKGKHLETIKNQIETALFNLGENEIQKIIIAYEPIWAIGTGKTPTAKEIQEVHFFIRKLIAEKYNKSIAEKISILYGGSVKPNNAKEIFSLPDVDGGLIGGACLKIEDFSKIIEAFSN